MPRMARVVAAGVPHHITQRGNNRQITFVSDADRRLYLDLILEECQRCGIRVLGYCLMSNHVHLVAVPEFGDSFARGLRKAHSRYARVFNLRYGRSGHLWQGRYYSCPLDADHLVQAVAYVDLNPVRAGIVGEAELYPWSSARTHAGFERSPLIDEPAWKKFQGAEESRAVPAQPAAASTNAAIREATYGGRPLGNDAFVSALEPQMGRMLRRQKPGPKPKRLAAVR